MQIDLTELKSSLERGEDMLFDGGYLEPDIKVIYDYYKSSGSKPPIIQEYFNNEESFDFIKFLTVYLRSAIGIDVKIDYTKDQWLKIGV